MARKKPKRSSSLPDNTESTAAPFRFGTEGVCLILILAAGLWAYSNSFRGVFVLDDVRAIVQNETIRSVTSIEEVLSPPPRSTVSGRPIANLSFAINYAISALDVRSYHVLNLLIHLGCALTLFGVVRRTLQSSSLRAIFGADATYVATAVALIWVVHPLTTSAVTYVVQRVESLMSLFYLLTLYCAIRAAESARRGLWTVASIASCALGVATKEVMITAPVAVVLWDVVFRPGQRVRWGLRAGLAATWLVFAALVSGEQREASIAMSGTMVWRYLLTQAQVLTQYLRLAFVPAPLVFLYTWPLVTTPADVIVEGLLIAVLLLLTAVGIWKRHPLGYAGALFFVILAPTSSIIPIVTEVAAEHRMYLPLAAIVSGVVGLAYVGLQRTMPRRAVRDRRHDRDARCGGRSWRRDTITEYRLRERAAALGRHGCKGPGQPAGARRLRLGARAERTGECGRGAVSPGGRVESR